MVTFVGDKQSTLLPATVSKTVVTTPVGSINLIPLKHIWQIDRMWLWFPLTLGAECFGKTPITEWLKVYPRIIQWTDGKYYTYRGTHSSIDEFKGRAEEAVFYREILVENGEKIEYY
jgi:hypothetical protein